MLAGPAFYFDNKLGMGHAIHLIIIRPDGVLHSLCQIIILDELVSYYIDLFDND